MKDLIDQLPMESGTKTAARDAMTDEQLDEAYAKPAPPGHGSWSHQELLAALTVDVLQQIRHVLVGGKGDPPNPLPRPGVRPARARRLTQQGYDLLAARAAAHEEHRRAVADGG